jgi:hypothetical protein
MRVGSKSGHRCEQVSMVGVKETKEERLVCGISPAEVLPQDQAPGSLMYVLPVEHVSGFKKETCSTARGI